MNRTILFVVFLIGFGTTIDTVPFGGFGFGLSPFYGYGFSPYYGGYGGGYYGGGYGPYHHRRWDYPHFYPPIAVLAG